MAKEENLTIDQNGKFEYTVQVDGVTLPLVGWTAAMKIATERGDAGVELASYDTTTPGANFLAVVGAAGQVHIDIPKTETDGYDWDHAVYDVYAGPANEYRILQGRIRVSAKVN